jgi:hypothetical protein
VSLSSLRGSSSVASTQKPPRQFGAQSSCAGSFIVFVCHLDRSLAISPS